MARKRNSYCLQFKLSVGNQYNVTNSANSYKLRLKAEKLLLVQLVDFLVVVKNRSLKILKNNCMSGS
ncbi:Hypothetical protein PHPALM_12097 [Phytophthora palmivora]|uniref:Uncharacterized protein n=1 Tax=Phytophthora palmivora TaxID=4796 RepID=A0A2P4Y0M4_9STRA|nr:Hypothetical protein PHPALM_12097 [Phytophthora palmivora]